ncbi:hypothetical protein ACO03_21315 (plasmid) [Pantoea ananatis]|nr:hypothetical protein ACO03_21315 [Pantoea ananatis]
MSRKESAQALYLYLAELPPTFYRIGFDRLRERLQLTSHLGNQNAIVKNALQQLNHIGFLEYSVDKERGLLLFAQLNQPASHRMNCHSTLSLWNALTLPHPRSFAERT